MAFEAGAACTSLSGCGRVESFSFPGLAGMDAQTASRRIQIVCFIFGALGSKVLNLGKDIMIFQ